MFSKLTRSFTCDVDLTLFSCKRVRFIKHKGNRYMVHSNLTMPRSCMVSFVERVIKRRVGSFKWVLGNCSKPDGYLFRDESPA